MTLPEGKTRPVVDANFKAGDPSPWTPISDPVDLKHLGKFAEEIGESGSVVGRCIIQGMDGVDPASGKTNRQRLEDEIADLYANAELVVERFGLDRSHIDNRAAFKMNHLRRWHAMAGGEQ
jgi:hypothetical protein